MCQRPYGDKDNDIKALVVAFSFHLLIQKCFPFPYMIYVNIDHLLLYSFITNIDFFIYLVTLIPCLVFCVSL